MISRGASAVNSSRERKQWKKPESRTASQNKQHPAGITSIILDLGSVASPSNEKDVQVANSNSQEAAVKAETS